MYSPIEQEDLTHNASYVTDFAESTFNYFHK